VVATGVRRGVVSGRVARHAGIAEGPAGSGMEIKNRRSGLRLARSAVTKESYCKRCWGERPRLLCGGGDNMNSAILLPARFIVLFADGLIFSVTHHSELRVGYSYLRKISFGGLRTRIA
jgi:hypothetical protein